ncbi:MAG: Cell division protein ZapE [Pseudomonadota bacterium]|jgi:cell division protein ZapE
MNFKQHMLAVAKERGMTLDEAQLSAVDTLSDLHLALSALKQNRASLLGRVLKSGTVPKGLYCYGGVGRGKSFLMDQFFAACEHKRKVRIHFHAFMRSVHEELKLLKQQDDPIEVLCESLAKRYRLICLDEFHVNDIADAMILGRVFSGAHRRGVVFVLTSNYAPDELYRNGLQRERFLPTIDAIKDALTILRIDAGTDYRRRTLTAREAYYFPVNEKNEAHLAALYAALEHNPRPEKHWHVAGRDISVKERGDTVIWTSFEALCVTARSQEDYLELARLHQSLLLSGVPRLSTVSPSSLRRFTLLVDVLYDHRVKLVMTAEAPLHILAEFDPQVQDANLARMLSEFVRTASRLTEMQSADYLALAHLPFVSL